MSYKQLSELSSSMSNSSVPYPNDVIKVKVIKIGHTATVTSSSGDEIKILNFSIADQSLSMQASLNDVTKHKFIISGRSLHIRNFLVKGSKVIMTAKTKIFLGQPINVPDSIQQSAVEKIIPKSPVKSIKEANDAPIKDMLTIQGKLIKDEAVKKVNVNGTDTDIRIITLSGSGLEIQLTLWRELSQVPLTIGQYIQASHCTRGEWLKRPTLNTTRNTEIQNIAAPETILTGIVEGITIGAIASELSLNTDNEYLELKVDTPVLLAAMNINQEQEVIDSEAMEMHMASQIPFSTTVTIRGTDILNMTVEI